MIKPKSPFEWNTGKPSIFATDPKHISKTPHLKMVEAIATLNKEKKPAVYIKKDKK